MKNSTTAERLKKLMDERNLKQVDILKMAEPLCKELNVKMNKSDISQYVHGKTNPTQEKLYVLCAALGVSEGWLMGHDVPMERISDTDRFAAKVMQPFNQAHPDLLSIEEMAHIKKYRQLTQEFRERVNRLTDSLLAVQSAEEDLLAAHRRTDDISQEGYEDPARNDAEIMRRKREKREGNL